MQVTDSTVKAVAMQSALRLLDEAGARIQQAVQLLKDSGQEALAEKVVGSIQPETETVKPGVAAHQRLLQKLLPLADTIDDMADAEWSAWVNALPQDEFLDFIAISRDELMPAHSPC